MEHLRRQQLNPTATKIQLEATQCIVVIFRQSSVYLPYPLHRSIKGKSSSIKGHRRFLKRRNGDREHEHRYLQCVDRKWKRVNRKHIEGPLWIFAVTTMDSSLMRSVIDRVNPLEPHVHTQQRKEASEGVLPQMGNNFLDSGTTKENPPMSTERYSTDSL